MAKIDQKAYLNATAHPVKIGNNRTARVAADGTRIFALHGHDIVAASPKGIVTLDPRG